jgi:hypothetical protein
MTHADAMKILKALLPQFEDEEWQAFAWAVYALETHVDLAPPWLAGDTSLKDEQPEGKDRTGTREQP